MFQLLNEINLESFCKLLRYSNVSYLTFINSSLFICYWSELGSILSDDNVKTLIVQNY